MQAQTNFQQFVSSNKGKLITFKHQDATISKYVVDVCGEYFTCKERQTDAKIDGFYYFSDCEMYKPTLIETLARHRYVVLIGEKSPMCDAFFEYKYCKEANNTLMVIGKQLSSTNPDVGYAAPYIGEVWAIVEGKYTKVWGKTNGGFLIDGDDLKKIGIRKFDAISEGSKKQSREEEEEIKKQKVQWYKDNANDWFKLCEEEGSIYSDNFINIIDRINSEPYSESLYDVLCCYYNCLRDSFLEKFQDDRKNPRVQALTKRFLVLSHEFRKKFDTKKVSHLVDLIDEEISIKGEEEYERLFEDKKGSVTAESSVRITSAGPVNIKYAGRPMLVQVIKEYTSNDGSTYVDVKDMNNGQVATLIKDYIDEEGGASGPVKIEYKGKEKTVEIMNEYTHKNGKSYIWVRDLSDNGKTKTLFKEYVKYV